MTIKCPFWGIKREDIKLMTEQSKLDNGITQQSNSRVWDGSIASSFAGGTGASNNPYIIANESQLA